MTTAPRPRRATRLVDDLLRQIREGVVRPGTRLPTEPELGAHYGVSRATVREAIAQLQASGIVRTQQGRGTFVLGAPDARDFHVDVEAAGGLDGALELLEFRTAIEVEAAGLAALRRTPEHLAEAGAALAELATESAPARAVDADLAFHLAVARASGNRHVAGLLGSLGRGMLAIPRDRLEPTPERVALVHAEHAAVHAAIAAGDQLAARAAMRTHLAASRDRLVGD